MDQRFLVPALAIEAIGIVLFSIVYQFARSATSLETVALDANIAIFLLATSAGLSAILGVTGIIHRRGISRRTAGLLGLTSFVLGVYALLASFGHMLGYGDDTAACGGFPPGFWTSGNVLNRCSVWAVIHEDWVATIFLVILAISAAIFWASVVTRVRSYEDR